MGQPGILFYYNTMDPAKGRPSKDARLVIGALIIKHKLNLSDEETVMQIQENLYLQYFVGFSGYKDEVPFAPSLSVDHIGWDAFTESTDLKQQVEAYRRRFGYYPVFVLADQLYGSRDNRKYLKEKGIRFGGKALGRPPKQATENTEKIRTMKKQRVQDSRERIPIEGKFGQGKNGYRLNYIRAKLQKTSEAWINIFLVMNLLALLKKLGQKLTLSFLNRLFKLCCKTIFALFGNYPNKAAAELAGVWCWPRLSE